MFTQHVESIQSPHVARNRPDIDIGYRCRCVGPVPAADRAHMKRPADRSEKRALTVCEAGNNRDLDASSPRKLATSSSAHHPAHHSRTQGVYIARTAS